MTVRPKPMLIGMNNPLSHKPHYALWPEPRGCTGHRIWQMLHEQTGATPEDYVEAFDRQNLVIGDWDLATARKRATSLLEDGNLAGRSVVLFGAKVAQAFRMTITMDLPPLSVQRIGTVRLHLAPHPSGMNRWYNLEENRRGVSLLLADLYHSGRHEE